MEVEMKIRGLMMDPVTNMPIVVLKDANGRSFANMGRRLRSKRHRPRNRKSTNSPADDARPAEKCFARRTCKCNAWWSANCAKIRFMRLIWVERDGERMSIDSRPSDALALALRVDCPIFVEDNVLKNSENLQRHQRQID